MFARPLRKVLCASLFLTLASTASMADSRCQQLEELHRQYIGVTLTSSQQQLKRKLVAWYNANCRSRRASVR
ncbi:MAG TPA: hypothetical protein VHM64_25550 [Candidatus Binatia bacterium]|nr:hypothetical protein [Candidatus Binatia bacterium]